MDAVVWIDLASRIFEVAGVGVMVAGALVSLGLVVLKRNRETGASAFRHFRQKLGRSILLGLELLVAADIIRTVSEQPSLDEVLVLGLIVLIRTFLSFTLAVELEGYWPWQRARYKHLEHMEHGGHAPPRPPPPPPERGSRREGEHPAEH